MIKQQLTALMTAYNQLCEPLNKFEAVLDIVGGYIDIVQAKETTKQNCLLCRSFNEGMGELCMAADPPNRPPASVIVQGCKAFVHKDFDEKDAEIAAKEKKRYDTKSGFARDLDDEVPF